MSNAEETRRDILTFLHISYLYKSFMSHISQSQKLLIYLFILCLKEVEGKVIMPTYGGDSER